MRVVLITITVMLGIANRKIKSSFSLRPSSLQREEKSGVNCGQQLMLPSLDGWFPWLALFLRLRLFGGTEAISEEPISTSGALPTE